MKQRRFDYYLFGLPVPPAAALFGVATLLLLLKVRSLEAWAPPTLGIGSLLFPVRGSVMERVSESSNPRAEIDDASDFFVDAFWTGKVGGGARDLTKQQRRTLTQSQTAEFNKRYGGKRRGGAGARKRQSELFVLRNDDDDVIACAGVEVDGIPEGYLRGPTVARAPLMSNLAVSRKYRRRGLAEEIVSEVETYVRDEWGFDECYLYVERRNVAAVKLYQKMGYRKIWQDGEAVTLMPRSDGGLQSSPTVIVCMKKNLNASLLDKLLGR